MDASCTPRTPHIPQEVEVMIQPEMRGFHSTLTFSCLSQACWSRKSPSGKSTQGWLANLSLTNVFILSWYYLLFQDIQFFNPGYLYEGWGNLASIEMELKHMLFGGGSTLLPVKGPGMISWLMQESRETYKQMEGKYHLKPNLHRSANIEQRPHLDKLILSPFLLL